VSEATSGGAGQTFLRGERLYLRALRASDADRSVAWRFSPFPISARKAAEWLEKTVPEDSEKQVWWLLACRVSDDAPVGAAWLDLQGDWPSAWVRLHADPARDDADRQAIKADMVRLLIPWLGGERGAMSITIDLDGSEPAVLAAAAELGMRPAYRIRDGFWRDGAHRDWVTMQWLNPWWTARLGDPGAGIDAEGEPVLNPRSPAPLRRGESPFPMPPNAVIASERLALRPLEESDAEPIADTFLREPDAGFGHPRMAVSPLALASYYRSFGEQDMPYDTEFAIVLRETGEVIGENGIYYCDWVGRTAETGTWIYRPEHRGGGLGTEAKHLLLEWAFQRAGVHVVWSWVFLGNERSAAALRKQGYRDAGRIDWVGLAGDGLRSATVFDLLASEWRAARR